MNIVKAQVLKGVQMMTVVLKLLASIFPLLYSYLVPAFIFTAYVTSLYMTIYMNAFQISIILPFPCKAVSWKKKDQMEKD